MQNPVKLKDNNIFTCNEVSDFNPGGVTNFEFNYDDSGDFPILSFSGALDLYNAPAVRNEFQSIFDAGTRFYVVDMAELEIIDSAGLGVLINELKRVLDSEGEFVLSGLSEDIKSLFAITRYDAFFKIFESVKNAKRYLKDNHESA